MLRWLVPGTVALALVLIAPGALAHAPAVDTTPAPSTTSSTFEDIACIPTCDVDARALGNAPPILLVASGENVTWTSADGGSHTVSSDIPEGHKPTLLVTGTPVGFIGCLSESLNEGDPAWAIFEIREEGLFVFTGDTETVETGDGFEEKEIWYECQEANPTPDGGWLLSYHCGYHPRFQQAFVHVLPTSIG